MPVTQNSWKSFSCVFFCGLECVDQSFAHVAYFVFWKISGFELTIDCRSKQARYQLSHSCPWLSHPSPWLSQPSPWLSQPTPWISHPSPLLGHGHSSPWESYTTKKRCICDKILLQCLHIDGLMFTAAVRNIFLWICPFKVPSPKGKQ